MPEPTVLELQQQLTDRQLPCPDCGRPLLGARVWDAEKQEALLGLACHDCDAAYRVK